MSSRGLAVAVALGGLVFPAAASAGGESTNLGTEKGLNYEVGIVADFVGNSYDSFAECRDGDRPISGGIDLEFSAQNSRMGGTYPAQEDGFLWRSEGHNALGGPMDMSFFAVCRKLEPSVTKFRTAAKPLVSGQVQRVKASCPRGFEVTGGGLQGPDLLVQASAPYDSKDPGHEPDDGWKAAAVPNFTTDQDLLAYASCREASSWDLRYVKENLVMGSDGSGASIEVCTDGVVTGGGASIAADSGLARIHETFPADFGDGNDTPADGWASSVRNGTAAPVSAALYAICKT